MRRRVGRERPGSRGSREAFELPQPCELGKRAMPKRRLITSRSGSASPVDGLAHRLLLQAEDDFLPRGTRTAIDSLLPAAGAGREPAGR